MSENEKKGRIVVKVGTSTLTRADATVNLRSFDALSRVLSDIHNMGYEVVLVSSGAIVVGAHKLSMSEKPQELNMKQAAAAVGQCELMHLYDKSFAEYGMTVGQILLNAEDMDKPDAKLNLQNTFNALLGLGVIPIVNENDSVSFAEIESQSGHHKVFGDNDALSAVVAVLCGAEKLVLLSDIDGLYEQNPTENPDAALIGEVRVIDDNIRALAWGAGSSRGTGGMIAKLNAAELAMKNGIDMIIANGARPEALYDIVEGKSVGTLFIGGKERGND